MKIYPNAPSNICLEFKVWAPKLSRVTRRLFLLGSLKELGAWNIDKALKASPTKDMHVWSVEASVPAMSSFEWVWLSTNMNRGDVQWEKTTKRNRVVDSFSGTLHTIWAEDDEVFLQTAACLELTTFVRVDEGFLLVLTGSTPSTGEWNLHSAKPATEFPKRSGYWKVQVAYDALTNLDFKWAVVKEKDFGVVRVQEKMVHSVFGRKSWMRAVAPWMTSLVIVVDMCLQCDLMDTMQGRTDFIVKDRKKRLEDIKDWLTKSQGDSASTKKLPAAVERPASVSAQSLQAQVNRKVSVVNTITPPISPSTVQTSAKMDETEEFGRRREDLSKSERLTQLLYKKFNQQAPVHVLQGSGQKQAPSDKMNIDVANQVPLLDGGVALLMFSKPELVSESLEPALGGTESPIREKKDDKKAKSDSSPTTSKDQQTTEMASEMKEKSATVTVSQYLRTILSPENLLAGTDGSKKHLDPKLLTVNDHAGLAVSEKDIPLFSSILPPSFPMLQAQAEEITRHPTIEYPKRKVTITRVFTSQASKPKTPPEPTSLFEKFKQKSHESILGQKSSGTSSRGPFTPTRGQSSPSLPSQVGTEDITKDPFDLKEEQTNRRLWDRMRQKAIREEEDKNKE